MSGKPLQFEKERGVTEVEVTRGIAHITLTFADAEDRNQRLTVLRRFAEANLPVFLVKLLPEGLSFALREAQVPGGTELLDALAAELKYHYIMREGLALVTVRAGAMRDLSGVMATIYDAFVAQAVAVRQTGDAYNAVHCLVPGDAADRAVAALRSSFALDGTGNGTAAAAPASAEDGLPGKPKAL